MSRYRVTIPPFEVDAVDSAEAEAKVDALVESFAYDYHIEELLEPSRSCRHCGVEIRPDADLPDLWGDTDDGLVVCLPLVNLGEGGYQIHQPTEETP